jgi:hypothetical protein
MRWLPDCIVQPLEQPCSVGSLEPLNEIRASFADAAGARTPRTSALRGLSPELYICAS